MLLDIPEPKLDQKEVVASWRVPTYNGKIHKIDFEHGTTSGKRVLWIDDKEIFRRDWMFKLDTFQLEDKRCILRVDPVPGFKYEYLLFIDGKSYEQFTDKQAKALKIWEIQLNGCIKYRVVLEKHTLNVYLNGILREEAGEFVDDGTDVIFTEDGHQFVLSTRSSGNPKKHEEGMKHVLFVDGNEVNEILIES